MSTQPPGESDPARGGEAPRPFGAVLPGWMPWAMVSSLALACVVLWAQGSFLQQQTNVLKSQLDQMIQRAERLRKETADLKSRLAELEKQLKAAQTKD
ncbi:MAG: hypothetical protein HY300_14140 [Verrucomicrobia bacterium]|nr:hypothetical protein [Verrucomicrobiota bacterium]